jgi:hypothetical protein
MLYIISNLNFSTTWFQEVGCDGVALSDAKFDMCLVCGGRNRSCNYISNEFRELKPPGNNILFLVELQLSLIAYITNSDRKIPENTNTNVDSTPVPAPRSVQNRVSAAYSTEIQTKYVEYYVW